MTKIIDWKKENGSERTIGLELEFSGLELRDTADLIAGLFGGEVKEEHRYHYLVEGSRFGTFRVELDARILRKMAREDFFARWGLHIDERNLRDSLEDIMDRMARALVPLEIVMPPLPAGQIGELEPLRKKLQEHRAMGTEASWMNAFGLHINVESPDLEPDTILTYFRSFLVLYPWLLEQLEIDLSRRLSPFIDHFPVEYTLKVLEGSYDPDPEVFVSDYLEYNPTRNRPLDLLPILAMLREEQVEQELEHEKNKPRPTFHYRLPNSRIDDPAWNFTAELAYWMEVERLVCDREMLRKLCRLYRFRKEATVVSFRKEWAQMVTILLDLDE